MDKKRILIIDGHPDAEGQHFVHELAEFYRTGAKEGGHDVRMIKVGGLRFPLIKNSRSYLKSKVPESIAASQKSILWAEHVVMFYPLWLGTLPAKLKGFLEQVLRPGFAFAERGPGQHPRRLLKGRSARLVVTRGMPGLFDEVDRSPNSIRNVADEVLGLCGVKPVRIMVYEGAESMTDAERDKAHYDMRSLGANAR
ncbi:MAG TPA: NAD(P)H-dependent oxidoreductase [Steroidobacteraceae bacterium]|nr:NAD(P)H-dependent oxidoreductase [Steroidobacteraceae bacterium]